MAHWKTMIELFDAALEERMKVIRSYELTGIDIEEALSVFITRALGFIDRKRFPTWRDSSKEWRIRNEERFKFIVAIWREKNKEDQAKKKHQWYLIHRKEVINRVKEGYRQNPEPTKLRVKEWKKNHRKKELLG